jgi:Arc/MetJ-type ribon-helix-helix transcriptional regulator
MRSYRIPLSLDQWLSEQAKARNTSRSELVRQLIELGRQTLEAADRPISLADALRALAGVRSPDAA